MMTQNCLVLKKITKRDLMQLLMLPLDTNCVNRSANHTCKQVNYCNHLVDDDNPSSGSC